MYLAWMRRRFPELYYTATAPVILQAKTIGLSGFFDSLVGGFKSVVTSVTTALPGLAKTYTEYDLQKRLIAANTKRASQGLPPLDYGPNGELIAQPIPYAQADWMLAQQVQPSLIAGVDNQTLLLLGGALLLFVFLKR